MSFTYLASPYTHASRIVRQQRYEAVVRAAAQLMLDGQVVFSPIAHSHPVETLGMPAPQSGAFWMKQDLALLRHADRLLILALPGYEDSAGIKQEIEFALSKNIPVELLQPEAVGLDCAAEHIAGGAHE